jgi:flagellar export protein FliJ
MKKFRFRLSTLLRLREATRDERRAQLAEAFSAEQQLKDRRAEVVAEANDLRQRYGGAAKVGVLDVDQLLDSHRYGLILLSHLKIIDEQMQKLAAEIEKRRQALVAADRDVRVLEKLRDAWKERYDKEGQVAETKQLDEVASRRSGTYEGAMEGAL